MTGTVVISRLAPPIIMNLNCLVTTTHYSARPVSAGWSLTNLIVRVYRVQSTVYSLQSTLQVLRLMKLISDVPLAVGTDTNCSKRVL